MPSLFESSGAGIATKVSGAKLVPDTVHHFHWRATVHQFHHIQCVGTHFFACGDISDLAITVRKGINLVSRPGGKGNRALLILAAVIFCDYKAGSCEDYKQCHAFHYFLLMPATSSTGTILPRFATTFMALNAS